VVDPPTQMTALPGRDVVMGPVGFLLGTGFRPFVSSYFNPTSPVEARRRCPRRTANYYSYLRSWSGRPRRTSWCSSGRVSFLSDHGACPAKFHTHEPGKGDDGDESQDLLFFFEFLRWRTSRAWPC